MALTKAEMTRIQKRHAKVIQSDEFERIRDKACAAGTDWRWATGWMIETAPFEPIYRPMEPKGRWLKSAPKNKKGRHEIAFDDQGRPVVDHQYDQEKHPFRTYWLYDKNGAERVTYCWDMKRWWEVNHITFDDCNGALKTGFWRASWDSDPAHAKTAGL